MCSMCRFGWLVTICQDGKKLFIGSALFRQPRDAIPNTVQGCFWCSHKTAGELSGTEICETAWWNLPESFYEWMWINIDDEDTRLNCSPAVSLHQTQIGQQPPGWGWQMWQWQFASVFDLCLACHRETEQKIDMTHHDSIFWNLVCCLVVTASLREQATVSIGTIPMKWCHVKQNAVRLRDSKRGSNEPFTFTSFTSFTGWVGNPSIVKWTVRRARPMQCDTGDTLSLSSPSSHCGTELMAGGIVG